MKHTPTPTPTTPTRRAESVRAVEGKTEPPADAREPLLPAKVSHGAVTLERSLEGWSVTLYSGSRTRQDLFLNGSIFLMTVPLSMILLASLVMRGFDLLIEATVFKTGFYAVSLVVFAIFCLIPYTTGRLLLRTLSTTRLEVVGSELRVRRWWAGRERTPLRVPLSAISAPIFTGTFHSQKLHLSETVSIPSYVAKKNRALVLRLLSESIAFARQHPEQIPPIPEDLQAMMAREEV